MKTMLDWEKECQKDQTVCADRKIWETKCGKYRVIFSHIRYGEGILPDQWYAMELNNKNWDVISKHRKKTAAQKACEKSHKKKEKDAAKLERLEKHKRSKKSVRTTRSDRASKGTTRKTKGTTRKTK
jgi:hypothetical protein